MFKEGRTAKQEKFKLFNGLVLNPFVKLKDIGKNHGIEGSTAKSYGLDPCKKFSTGFKQNYDMGTKFFSGK